MTETFSLPAPGQIARVRQRLYLVEQTVPAPSPGDSTLVKLSCVDDDAQGQRLEVLWEREIDPEIQTGEAWDAIAKRGFDPARTFAAYLNTLRWNCVTATDPRLFQSPFRAGIRLDAYQLEPLRKALLLPRVNLFIADDVGLGKTIEALLIGRELLHPQEGPGDHHLLPAVDAATSGRRRLENRFGLTFEILDKEYISQVRRERGYGVNPWGTHTRFLVSHRLLIDEALRRPLARLAGRVPRRHAPDPRRGPPRRPVQRPEVRHRLADHPRRPRPGAAVRAPAVPLGHAAQRPLQQLLGPAGNPRPAAVLPRRAGQASGCSTT